MRILHVLSDLGGGGVASLLINYYEKIADKCHFDYVVTANSEGTREQLVKKMGSRVFHVPELHKDLYQHLKMLQAIIKKGKYDVVHVHGDYKGVFALYYAKRYKVKMRIAHSHRTMFVSKFDKIQSRFFIPLTKLLATNLAACGSEAGKAIWGEKNYESGAIHIIRNAIPLEHFAFSQDKRNNVKRSLGIENKFVIGTIGRLNFQKNQLFLIRAFNKLLAYNSNAVLIIAGEGELREQLECEISKLNISDKVLLLGMRNDIPDLVNAFDVFVLTSLFEGLPVTMVEVQANGVPCVIADTITKEIQLSNYVKFLSLDESTEKWAKCIMNNNKRYDIDVAKSGYDINVEAHRLISYYRGEEN